MASTAQIKANSKYDKAHTKPIMLKLNRTNDADILAKLDDMDNKQGYIKRLIREDIRGAGSILSMDALRYLVYPVAKRNGLRSVYLFGSYARGEATANSDVDLMIDSDTLTTMRQYTSLEKEMEEAFGKGVDLVMAGATKENTRAGRRFLSHFERDKVLLYEDISREGHR